MNRNEFSMRRPARLAFATTLSLAAAIGSARAVDTCITPDPGDVHYVAYQNNPAGPEYIVDLGSKDQFLTATTKLTFADIRVADFATVFSPVAPNLSGSASSAYATPATRDAIVSANGPKDSLRAGSQLDHRSRPADRLVGDRTSSVCHRSRRTPCSLNAGPFPGRVFGSYQDTLNGTNPRARSPGTSSGTSRPGCRTPPGRARTRTRSSSTMPRAIRPRAPARERPSATPGVHRRAGASTGPTSTAISSRRRHRLRSGGGQVPCKSRPPINTDVDGDNHAAAL